MRKRNRKVNIKRLTIKFFLCIVYLMIITILVVGSYNMFIKQKEIVAWNSVKNVEQYTYLEISKMSEKFAYYENENVGFHFVMEEQDTGQWQICVIAIDEDKYDQFKNIIDYSYERIDTMPDKIKVYGYPIIMSDELKEMLLNHIGDFLPAENEVEITQDNLEKYLTNSYLDTTKNKVNSFDFILFVTLLLLFIMIILLIFTILDHDKIVDNIDNKVTNYKEKRILKVKILRDIKRKKKK